MRRNAARHPQPVLPFVERGNRAQPDAKYLFNLRYSAVYLLAMFFFGPSIAVIAVMALDELGRGHLANLNIFDNQCRGSLSVEAE